MIDLFFNHRSIRKFKDQPVEEDLLNQVLQAGVRASTTGNMQVYSIVITKDKKTKKQLWECHFKQDMVLEAPLVLTFCADFNRFSKWCRWRNADPGYDNFLSFYTASVDALLASQNIALAAESNGLGICYLGTTNYMADEIIEILDLPELVVPVTTLVIGYPDENPGLTDRLPLEAVVHHEKYKDYNQEKTDDYYSEKESLDFTRELLEINQKETLAQIFTENRYTKKNNVVFSKKLLKTLEKQGYMNQ